MRIDRISLKKVLLILIITVCIELFICNYSAFRTLICGNNNINVSYTIEDNKIFISNINKRVTSITFEYKNKLEDKITYNLAYEAKENSALVKLNPKVILPSGKQCINFDTHSECKTIEVEIETKENLDIEKIVLNHANMNINITRIALTFITISILRVIKNRREYESDYDSNSKEQTIGFLLEILVIFICIVVYTVLQNNTNKIFIKSNEINNEDSLLMQTESFMNGQIKLMKEPSERLKEMENPYDNEKRDEDRIPFLYDVAYYNGAYYNYFGVAPIITCILPFRLITGGYVQCYIFNLVFVLGAMISLYYLYKRLLDKFIYRDISTIDFQLGYFAILFGANILTLLRGAKYDIVITSGIMFTLISMGLAISIYEEEGFKPIKLILLGITSAFMVLSKPTFIVYYLLILFFIINGMKNNRLKYNIVDGIIICIPLGIFAILQMALNYLRFDSIFEFGAKYQLTSFNMISCMGFSFGKIYAGFMEYIFRIPSINPLEFPFVFINTKTSLVSINEVLYENRLVGLVAIPILWIYLFMKKSLEEDRTLKRYVYLSLVCVFIAIVLNTCLGGVCEAYAIDFKLILCINAVIMFFNISDDDNVKKIFITLSILTIIIMIPISFTTESNFLINLKSPLTVYLKNLFEFWA